MPLEWTKSSSAAGTMLVAAGLSKSFGRFALAVSGSYSNQRELTLGLQLFVALGREPRTGKWFTDAVPMAGMGAVSARAFVDRNLNGIRDPDEGWCPMSASSSTAAVATPPIPPKTARPLFHFGQAFV